MRNSMFLLVGEPNTRTDSLTDFRRGQP